MEAGAAEYVVNGRDPEERFVVLSGEDLRQGWQFVSPLLEDACRKAPDMTMAKLVDGLGRGVYAIAAIVSDDGDCKALAVFEVRDHERGSALWIVLATGHDAITWSDYDASLKDVARALGCSVIRVRGRKGWIRTLKHWRWILELDV